MQLEKPQPCCLTCLNLQRERGRAYCDAVAESTCRAFKLHNRDLTKVLHSTVRGANGKEFLFGAFCSQYGKPLAETRASSKTPFLELNGEGLPDAQAVKEKEALPALASERNEAEIFEQQKLSGENAGSPALLESLPEDSKQKNESAGRALAGEVG